MFKLKSHVEMNSVGKWEIAVIKEDTVEDHGTISTCINIISAFSITPKLANKSSKEISFVNCTVNIE